MHSQDNVRLVACLYNAFCEQYYISQIQLRLLDDCTLS